MNFLGDLKYTIRNLISSLGSSSMIVAIMAFGIGISVTMFVFVKGILWNDMGVVNEDRLVNIRWEPDYEAGGTFPRQIRIMDYLDFKKQNQSMESMVAINQHGPSFSYGGDEAYPVRYSAGSVTWDFFELLGVKAQIGRTFIEDDVAPGSEQMVVLSHGLWKEKFGGDPEVINMTGRIEGQPSRIVGIMPEEFATFPTTQRYWRAVSFEREWGADLPRAERTALTVLGVLREGVTTSQAELDFETIASSLAEEYPDSNEKLLSLRIKNYTSDLLDSQTKTLLITLLSCGGMVFLVACANVSNLMLARAARRSFEFAVRNSMGASKWQIMYQVFLDGFALTIVGGLGGLLIAKYGAGYIWNIVQEFGIPFWMKVELDAESIGLAIGAMMLASFLASLIPALRSSRRDSFGLLRDDSRTSSSLYMGKLSKVLVGGQIALALALTTVAVLMIMIRTASASQPSPYDGDKIVTTTLWYGATEGFDTEESIHVFIRNLKTNMVEKGAENLGFYLNGGDGANGFRSAFEHFGESYEDIRFMPEARTITATPEYFQIYELGDVRSGRLFNEMDTADSQPVAIVNSAFVETHYPGEDPIGQQIRFPSRNDEEAEWLTVVGVVPDYIGRSVLGEPASEYATIYRPYRQNFGRWGAVALKIRDDGERWKLPLRLEMAKLAPYTATNDVRTVTEIQAFQQRFFRLIIDMFMVFGLVSFLVASFGLYAVISFSTTQRFREFGIRMALGGRNADIIRTIVRSGLIQISVGVVFGVVLGQVISGLMQQTLDITGLPSMWISAVAAAALVIASSALSLLVPALSAIRLDPIKALRYS